MHEHVFRAKFVLPIVYTMVAVVLREGVYSRIAGSTTLCKLINRSSTGSQWFRIAPHCHKHHFCDKMMVRT